MTAPAPEVWAFSAIGTAWEIVTDAPLSPRVRDQVMGAVTSFDRDWSRFREDSTVTRIATHGGGAHLQDAGTMLDVFAELYDATDAAVNPLVATSLNALGYDAAYSLRGGAPAPVGADFRTIVGWDVHRVDVTEPVLLDIGALGKGRLVDVVWEIVTRRVAGSVTVDAGGDMRVTGEPIRVALEHPYDPSKAIGVMELEGAALAASAGNRRAWGDGLHHILDARTGLPVQRVVATWAVHPTAMRADALATALFHDGGPELAEAWGADWVRMFSDGHVEYTAHTSMQLFFSGV